MNWYATPLCGYNLLQVQSLAAVNLPLINEQFSPRPNRGLPILVLEDSPEKTCWRKGRHSWVRGGKQDQPKVW